MQPSMIIMINSVTVYITRSAYASSAGVPSITSLLEPIVELEHLYTYVSHGLNSMIPPKCLSTKKERTTDLREGECVHCWHLL